MNNKKWVIVTGASSGIGMAAAQLLLEKGYGVVCTARNQAALEKLCSPFEQGTYEIVPWDLADIDSLPEYAKTVHQRVGAIHGLVHCAGIQSTVPLHLTNGKKLLDVFNINTFAAIRLVGLFSKQGAYTANESSFVLISSIAAHEGAVGKSVYAASKGALEGFLKPAAAELLAKGIRLNVIVPGMVQTKMNEEFFANLTNEQKDNILNSYPLGMGESQDVTGLIHYLLGLESKWITGQKFIIDGGHLARKV
jgi:NAD(P)-dependent dehydrogenase (short-subunit alcohol dehydrogenase family)